MTAIDQARPAGFCTSTNWAARVSAPFIVALVLISFGCGRCKETAAPGQPSTAQTREFEPASTVEETWRQHEALPDPAEMIWWDINGPDMLWNNKNLHQIVPTVNVYRDGPVRDLSYKPMVEIAAYEVETPNGKMSFQDFLLSENSSTMGVVIVHHGAIVFELYPRMQPYEKPIWWSVTKAFVSTVLAILEDRGLVDVSLPIDHYIPELAGSDFEGVKIRDILDMASGVDCPDGDYSDKRSCYLQFQAALGDSVRFEDSPDSPYDYLANLDVGHWSEPGTGFDYSGANTFVIGWLVEILTGMPLQDALSKEIWTRMGAESDASFYAARNGIPMMDGGLLARPRDVARFGLLFTPSWGVVTDEPILSERYLNLLTTGGRPEILRNNRGGWPVPEDIKWNVYQWDEVYTNNDIYKGGWVGQGLLINPDRDLVAVWVGYDAGTEGVVSAFGPVREVLEGVFGE
jgi:CubicO group peptidase (beta-lactamase class C family)